VQVPPGTAVGPLGLPASYTTPQRIQLGFIEGRWNASKHCWELRKNGEWATVAHGGLHFSGKQFEKKAGHYNKLPRLLP